MRKVWLFTILLFALLLSAANPWPSLLRVWNRTGDNVYIRLSQYGTPQYFLTATVKGNTSTYNLSIFEVARKKYTSEVTACGVTAKGTMDMNHNLKLTFTECNMMRQYWRPLYFGEPGMEKPNFYQHWTITKKLAECEEYPGGWECEWEKDHKLGWVQWRFQYDLPKDYEKEVTFWRYKDEFPGVPAP